MIDIGIYFHLQPQFLTDKLNARILNFYYKNRPEKAKRRVWKDITLPS